MAGLRRVRSGASRAHLSFRERLSRIVAVRVAGAALATAGLACMGLGTLASPVTTGMAPASTPVCASGTECIHATQVPTAGDRLGCTAIQDLLGMGPLDSTDSYWHFVIPASQGFLFNSSAATSFSATFSPSTTEHIVTLVQPVYSGLFLQGYRGIVLETDRVTLTWASIPDSGTTETTEAEGTGPENSASGGDFQLSSSCAGTITTTTTTTAGSSTTSSSSSTSTTSQSSTTSTAPGSTTSTTARTSTTSSSGSGVAGASTSTPGTGATIMFGLGLGLLAGGAALLFGGRRLRRRLRK